MLRFYTHKTDIGRRQLLVASLGCRIIIYTTLGDLKEDSDVDSDNMNSIETHKYVDDKEKMQEFVNNIIRSATNENLMKAKLTVAAESKNKNND